MSQRLGRKTRLGERQREALWEVFQRVREVTDREGLLTPSMVMRRVGDVVADGSCPYQFAVVDEAQDISVPELRLLAALGRGRADALFFAGDLGQRIFQTPFSWKSLGVDVRGRSSTLRINYRTSHQIRLHADRLLPLSVSDVDGINEDRRGVISVIEGTPPNVRIAESVEEEMKIVASWIKMLRDAGISPEEIGIFVRSDEQLLRAEGAITGSSEAVNLIGRDHNEGGVRAGSMHHAKGLEFRAVAVMACDDEVIPDQGRIERVVDEADLEEVYNTERHLLYVACTRARDHLLLSGVDPVSEFVEDLEAK